MIDVQKLMDGFAEVGLQERSRYHFTFGDLIDRLRIADNGAELQPRVVGIGAYRGCYSDIALCTESGTPAYKKDYDYTNSDNYAEWYKENVIHIDFAGTPKKLADKLEALIGNYFDGYKGGFNEITRDKPLWLAADYGDSSDMAIVDITDDLKILTKLVT